MKVLPGSEEVVKKALEKAEYQEIMYFFDYIKDDLKVYISSKGLWYEQILENMIEDNDNIIGRWNIKPKQR